MNFGVRDQLKQTQIGIGFGFIPFIHEGIGSISGNVFYHFAGTSKLSERRPWYGRIGLDYLRDENASSIDNNLYLNLRIGRDLNISRKVGVEIDAGPCFQLSHKRIIKTNNPWNLDINPFMMPSMGVTVFYRI